MKKILLIVLFFSAVFSSKVQAQYTTALGLQLDFGDGSTLAGPSITHFFNNREAIVGDILFGDRSTWLQAFYQYHSKLPNAKDLNWYLGGGPSVALYKNGSSFFLRPMLGIDYKPAAPFDITFDWRPFIYLGNEGGSRFTGARFGMGFKYVIR